MADPQRWPFLTQAVCQDRPATAKSFENNHLCHHSQTGSFLAARPQRPEMPIWQRETGSRPLQVARNPADSQTLLNCRAPRHRASPGVSSARTSSIRLRNSQARTSRATATNALIHLLVKTRASLQLADSPARRIGRPRVRVAAIIIAVILTTAGFGEAQIVEVDPPDNAAQAAASTDNSSPQRGSLDMFYLKNNDGQLVLVPDMTFEDFARLNKLDRQLTATDKLPDFELSQLSITGSATEKVAELVAELRVRQLRSGTIRVPLKLSEAVLKQDADLRANIEAIEFNPESGSTTGDGYVVWLAGNKGTEHKLALRLSVAINVEGSLSSLKLTLPNTADSKLQIDVPGSRLAAKSSDEGRTVLVTTDGDRSTLTTEGLTSASTISWTPMTTPINSRQRVVLEARGDHRVRVRGPGLVSTESRFRFFGRGGLLDSVQIRLPQGARILAYVENAEYSVTPVTIDQSQRQTIEVRFQEPDDQPRDVVIQTEHTVQASAADLGDENKTPIPTIEVAGFDVIGAVRHYGRITLAAENAWLLRWEESTNTRRVAHDPLADGPGTVAAFEYFRQLAKLPIRVARKATRTQSRSRVDLSVLSTEVNLDAAINVRVSGAPASFVQIHLPGWEIVDLTVPDAVAKDQIRQETTPLVLPFRQPFTGEIEVRITARRSLAAPIVAAVAQEVSLPMPYVLEATNRPINLQLFTQPNLVATPREDLVEAILEPAAAENNQSPISNSANTDFQTTEAMRYVFRGDPQTDEFVCAVQTRPQSVSGELQGNIRIEHATASATISVTANVMHEPVEAFQFEFRGATAREVIVRLDGQPLDSSLHSWSTDEREESATLAIQLPNPILGACELELAYTAPIASDGSQLIAEVPLPQLGPGEFQNGPIVVQCAAGVVASVADETWTVEKEQSNRLIANNSVWTNQIPLDVQELPNRGRQPNHVVERAYWQTWMTARQRQDRVILAITADKEFVDLVLPKQVDQESMHLLVAGQLLTPEIEGDRLRLKLARRDKPTIIELFLPYRERAHLTAATIPQVVDAKWTRKLYWEVILPSDEFIVAPPTGVESEDSWSMLDVASGHRTDVNQLWLENWAGGSRQVAPAQSMNRYLFSSFGDVSTIQMRTAKRSTLLLFVAAAVFGLGVVPSLIPALQRPGFLFVIAALLACSAVLFPVHTLIVAPAAAVGAILLAISKALAWWKQHRRSDRRSRSDSSHFAGGSSMANLQAAPTTISALPPLHVSAPDN